MRYAVSNEFGTGFSPCLTMLDEIIDSNYGLTSAYSLQSVLTGSESLTIRGGKTTHGWFTVDSLEFFVSIANFRVN
jgi:hypothetical protein